MVEFVCTGELDKRNKRLEDKTEMTKKSLPSK